VAAECHSTHISFDVDIVVTSRMTRVHIAATQVPTNNFLHSSHLLADHVVVQTHTILTTLKFTDHGRSLQQI
jgi:hypothetical protein